MTFSQLASSNLYDLVLMNPVRSGANRLLVVSGYATPQMASQTQSDAVARFGQRIDIDLVVGMTGHDGLVLSEWLGYEQLRKHPASGSLKTSFMPTGQATHSKLYVWLKGAHPERAFVGSSNFTHSGFLISDRSGQRDEILVEVSPIEALAEFRRLEERSVASADPDLFSRVRVFDRMKTIRSGRRRSPIAPPEKDIEGRRRVLLPLVMTGGSTITRGQVHPRAGLNWGQRPEWGRNPDQAYIPIPAAVSRSGFFPPRGEQFLVSIGDTEAMIMVVAEAGGKALHSPQGNNLIGQYFRRRLGLSEGVAVTQHDLLRFGSRFVCFTNNGNGSYRMEFDSAFEEDGVREYGI